MKSNNQPIDWNDFKRSCCSALSAQYTEPEVHQLLKILLPEILSISYNSVVLNGFISLTLQQQTLWQHALTRLQSNEPYQYIINKAWFYDLEFYVDKNVLIPRPETEELVAQVLAKNQQNNLQVIDIGTGSGCIAISLAKHLKNAAIFALDVSSEALQIAKRNAYANGVSILFKEADILHDDFESFPNFDLIVSNPPYIPNKEKELMQSNVLDFEPHVALFVENDNPLLFYEKIADFSIQKLKPKGQLIVECNEFNAKDLAALFASKGFKEVDVILDLQGKDRMVSGRI